MTTRTYDFEIRAYTRYLRSQHDNHYRSRMAHIVLGHDSAIGRELVHVYCMPFYRASHSSVYAAAKQLASTRPGNAVVVIRDLAILALSGLFGTFSGH